MLTTALARGRRARVWRSLLILAGGLLMVSGSVHAGRLHAPPTINEARALLQAERYEEAAKAFRAITEAEPDNGAAWFFLGYALHVTGDLDAALPAHMKASAHPQFAAAALYNAACVHARRGEVETAFAMLNKARAAGFSNINQLRTDSDLTAIRADSRFEKLLMQIENDGTKRPNQAPAASSRQFDFWIGEWDVFVSGDQKAGENRITRALDGALILEHWRGSRGGEGMSMNFIDAARGVWMQVWVDTGGEVIWTEGRFAEGAMRMTGTHTLRTGEVRPFRASYTPRDDGTVRQFLEESTDGGATWAPWFDGIYKPHVESEAVAPPRPGGPIPSAAPVNVGDGTSGHPGGGSGTGQPQQRPLSSMRRDFDFWIGEWDVLLSSGDKAGENSITRALNGHLLIERWTSAAGGGGVSFNFVDPATRNWKQVWIDARGGHTVKEGGLIDGAMRQTGSRTMPDGSVRLLRATWTPGEDGTVRQLLEESPDEGKTWAIWFDGRYVRKPRAPKSDGDN